MLYLMLKLEEKETLIFDCYKSHCNSLLLTVLLNALETILKIMVIALNEWNTSGHNKTVIHLKSSRILVHKKGSRDKKDII